MRPVRTTGWRVISDVEELDRLRDPWDALAAGSGMPTAQHAWASACAHAFHADDGVQVVAVVRDGRLVAVAPLVAAERPGELEPLAVPELSRPVDFLYADEEALEALTGALTHLGARITMPRIAAASRTTSALAGAFGAAGLVSCGPAPDVPTLPLDRRWTTPDRCLSARRRRELLRARHAAEAFGDVRYDLARPLPEEVDRLLDDAVAVDDSPPLHHPRHLAFVRHYLTATAAAGTFRVAVLRIAGRVAALQFAVEYDRRLWILRSSVADAYASCAPASLLFVESLRDAAARGVEACEFLGPSRPWTRLWTDQARCFVSLRVYPAAASGGLVGAGTRAGRAARRGLTGGRFSA
jgi:CelD/BcsL family acetyltransferase involved in cellulose biosynthesis